MRRLTPVVVVLAVVLAAGCADRRSDGDTATGPGTTAATAASAASTASVATTRSGRARPAELGAYREIRMVVSAADGSTNEFCLLLADTEALQNHGLMNVTDLGDYAGMVFRFGKPVTVSFYMRDTLIPLSIAFFDDAGRVISTADMAPCPASTKTCPTFGASRAFSDALEVPAGRLVSLGIVEGAKVGFGGSCPSL